MGDALSSAHGTLPPFKPFSKQEHAPLCSPGRVQHAPPAPPLSDRLVRGRKAGINAGRCVRRPGRSRAGLPGQGSSKPQKHNP